MSTWLTGSIQPRFRTIDRLSIRFAESEDRPAHALLLSPWPESLFAFEPIWLRLSEHAHLVAIDLPGFGHSQRRDALLSPRAMAAFLVRAADAFGLENPHVVGPDVGTPASLFAAALHPGRLRSLVVGSGGAALAPDLAGALTGIERYVLPDYIREDYLPSYEGDRFVESTRYVHRRRSPASPLARAGQSVTPPDPSGPRTRAPRARPVRSAACHRSRARHFGRSELGGAARGGARTRMMSGSVSRRSRRQ